MIFLQRGAPPGRLDLTDANSVAAKELQAAKDHWVDHEEALPAKEFKAYSDDTVREALKVMFHGKCAYCESKIAGSSQTDIEHYRPKAAVKESPSHPGYWWKAMDWDNLVLSCMHCNQERRQLHFPAGLSEAEIRQALIDNDFTTTGKKNAFPTENDQWIDSDEGDLTTEKPLLIDPTVTDPEPLLVWEDRDEFGRVESRDGDIRAETTISILGLNRRWLCEQRMIRWADIELVLMDIRIALEQMTAASTNEAAKVAKDAAQRDLNKLLQLCEDRQPHAAMARSALKRAQKMLEDAITP